MYEKTTDVVLLDLATQHFNEVSFNVSRSFMFFLYDFMVKSKLSFPLFYWLKGLGVTFFTRTMLNY